MKTKKNDSPKPQIRDCFGQLFTFAYVSGEDKNGIFGTEWPPSKVVTDAIIGNDSDCDASMDVFSRIEVGRKMNFFGGPITGKPLFTIKCIVSNGRMKTFTDGSITFTVRQDK